MKVLLDTNIYLNFFRKRDDQSLLYVKALLELIEKGKFQLILPLQIKNEFLYNKEVVIKEQINELNEGLKVTMKLPDFISKSQEVKKLNKAVKTLDAVKKRTIEQYKKRALNPNSNINKGLSKLFGVAKEIDGSGVIQRAYFRTLQGYPPRKGNRTFGDAITWETLLEFCADDDLIIISADGDYSADEKPKRINNFLESEWLHKSGRKTLKLYDNLGRFINDNSPVKEKPISKEMIEKDEVQLTGGLLELARHYTDLSDKLTTSLGITTKKCDCCGDNYQTSPYLTSAFTTNGNKCLQCSGLFMGECKLCKRCGKHYHNSLNALTFSIMRDLCDDCQPSSSLTISG
ncbi:DUF4935 domain-containing protein [Patescibacteria group bacterium]|nr:DUF4935 domain-containing protein [Patescibacteria group bacterium]